MENWNKTSFTELISDRTKDGIKLPTNEYNQSGLTAIIDQGQEFIAGYSDETEGAFTDVPAIIFGDHTRVFKYVDFPFFLGADGVKVLKANQEINYKYLYYYFLQAKFPNTGYARHFKWLKELQIPLLPLETQKNIAAVLDKCTALIAKHKLMLEKYEILIKSRFIEMFGDIQTYKKEAFKDCSLFIDYRGHTPEVTETGEIRMINAKSVGKGFFKYINEYITKEIYDVWMHRGFPKANDVLFVTEGHTFGNTCQVPSDFKIFALGQRVITIRGNEGKLNNFYLNSYMQTDDFNQDINKYKTGGTAQGIRSKDLIKVEIPIPPYEKQLQFAAFVQQIDKSKFEIWRYLNFSDIMKRIGFILYD